MMGAACPQFKVVSRYTITKDILAMFERERAKLREIITNSLGRVSFTTDNWKSEVRKFSYICITCHYVDDAWRLNKRIIWFKKLNPPHDGATIADEVHLCFREWKVDTKIMCLTLDNASYNDALVNTLRSTLLPKGVLPLFGTFFQVRCCAHILNLIVQAGLKLIDKSVDKIRDGIQYIKISSNRTHKFYETAQNIYHLNEDKRLRVDMLVRWNLTYTMLENSLYFKDALLWFGNRDGTFKSNFALTHDEWEKFAIMHDFLKTFYDVTCIMSGTKYPTSNLYFKCVFLVQSCILKACSEVKKFMAPMLTPMKEKFDRYWADYNVFLSCASVLDPRCKLGFVSYCYGKLYASDEAERRVDEVKKTLANLFAEYSGAAVSETPSDAGTNCRGSRGDGADMFNYYENYIQSQRKDVERSQLDLYLEETPRTLNDEFDVLEFWSKSSVQYPQLASMARDFLAIHISSVASEQAFSMSRKVITPNRASLKPKTIEALMCLQDWYRWKMSHNEEMITMGGGPSSSHAEELSSNSEND